jgi:hypothetical protein
MVTATDFLLGPDGDLLVENHDLVAGPSDTQHIEHILLAFPGFYREDPLVGVGLSAYHKSSGTAPEVQRKVAVQLQADNYQVTKAEAFIDVAGKMKVSIDAKRIR